MKQWVPWERIRGGEMLKNYDLIQSSLERKGYPRKLKLKFKEPLDEPCGKTLFYFWPCCMACRILVPRDWTQAHGSESTESLPLDRQELPGHYFIYLLLVSIYSVTVSSPQKHKILLFFLIPKVSTTILFPSFLLWLSYCVVHITVDPGTTVIWG